MTSKLEFLVVFSTLALVLYSVQSLEKSAFGKHDVSSANSDDTCIKKPGLEYPLDVDFDNIQKGLKSESILLIDVRNPIELLRFGELKGSVNLPLPEVKKALKMPDAEFLSTYKFKKPQPEDENVILTCRSGKRVLEAHEIFEAQGYCNIRVYRGSFLDWKAKGGPLITRTLGA